MGKQSKKHVKEETEKKKKEAELEEYKKDVEAFNGELDKICKKYSLGLVGVPHFAQMDNGAFAVSSSVRAVRQSREESELAEG